MLYGEPVLGWGRWQGLFLPLWNFISENGPSKDSWLPHTMIKIGGFLVPRKLFLSVTIFILELYAIIKKKTTNQQANKQIYSFHNKNKVSKWTSFLWKIIMEKSRGLRCLVRWVVLLGRMSSTALSWLNLPKFTFLCVHWCHLTPK